MVADSTSKNPYEIGKKIKEEIMNTTNKYSGYQPQYFDTIKVIVIDSLRRDLN